MMRNLADTLARTADVATMRGIVSTSPPGPSPLASAVGFVRDGPAFLQRAARDHGDVAAVRMGPLRMVLVNHPDLIEQVLVTDRQRYVKAGMARGLTIFGTGLLTSEGSFHDRQRRLAQGAFGEDRLAEYLAPVPGIVAAATAG